MNIIQSSTAKYVIKCRLCSKNVAESPALELPIIGHPGEKIEKLMQVLGKHLAKHHSEEFQRGIVIYQDFLRWLVLDPFEYEDASIAPRLENIRAALFQQLRKNSFTDEALATLAASIVGVDQSKVDQVLSALKLVRDACCEMGSYAPAIQQSPLVV